LVIHKQKEKMKRIFYAVLATAILTVFSAPLKAQINVSVNTESQPVWGPVGYDRIEYYYVPDLDVYYNVPQNRFHYWEKDRWVNNTNLPSRYNRFSLFNHYKVVVNEKEPWKKHKYYKDKYFSYRGRHDQVLIRDSRDSKYFVIKNHPEHSNWMKQKEKSNNSNNKNMNNSKNNKNKNNGDKNQKKK
jgi:hypothetical protein